MHLLLVGGGHAMLPTITAARSWAVPDLRVTVINTGRHLYYSGMVPEYLGGVYELDDIRVDLARVCSEAGVQFVDARAAAVEPDERVVTTDDGRRWPYDVVAFDIGGVNPLRPPQAVATKPLYHVHALSARVEAALDEPGHRLSVLVAGGGAAGVEIALNLTGRFACHGRRDDLTLTLAEPADRILDSFPAGLSAHVARDLAARGARIHTGASVLWNDGRPMIDGTTPVAADIVLWATGSIGQPLFRQAGLACDRQNYLRVGRTLQCSDHPRLFAAGDCATVDGYEHLRKIGVHAIKQGQVLRHNLHVMVSTLAHEGAVESANMCTFRPYPLAPLILSTGRGEGLWTAREVWLRGRPLLRLKHVVDRRWIRQYQDGTPSWSTVYDAASAADGSSSAAVR